MLVKYAILKLDSYSKILQGDKKKKNGKCCAPSLSLIFDHPLNAWKRLRFFVQSFRHFLSIVVAS